MCKILPVSWLMGELGGRKSVIVFYKLFSDFYPVKLDSADLDIYIRIQNRLLLAVGISVKSVKMAKQKSINQYREEKS